MEDRRQFLLLIASAFEIITENRDDFIAVLNAENFFDLEDGLQIKCAENANLDYIVTEALKDFKSASVAALSISSALSLF